MNPLSGILPNPSGLPKAMKIQVKPPDAAMTSGGTLI